MSKEKKIICANWKMNKNLQEAQEFLQNIDDLNITNELVICPPFTLLNAIKANDSFTLAGQDLSSLSSETGAFTGDISAKMLKDAGCKYVLIGHSERRKYYHESENLLQQKIINALAFDLIPILCVGESLNTREAGDYLPVLAESLIASLPNDTKSLDKIIIAYEPIWAIGTGKTASLIEIEEVHNFLSQILNTRFAKKLKILYGGSVNLNNAHEIIKIKSVAGLLIGGASLDPVVLKQIAVNIEG